MKLMKLWDQTLASFNSEKSCKTSRQRMKVARAINMASAHMERRETGAKLSRPESTKTSSRPWTSGASKPRLPLESQRGSAPRRPVSRRWFTGLKKKCRAWAQSKDKDESGYAMVPLVRKWMQVSVYRQNVNLSTHGCPDWPRSIALAKYFECAQRCQDEWQAVYTRTKSSVCRDG